MSDVTLKMLLLGEDRGASKALKDVGDSAEQAGGRLDKFGAGGKQAFAQVAGAAAALGGGALLLDQFNKALDMGAGTSKLTAQLGLSKTESAQAGRVAGSLFGDGYGDGMEQVQEAIGSVIQNIDGMRGASDKTLTAISGKVVNTANIFDQDLGGVTRAVGQLMRTGLAKDATEALDIVTKGFQSGADKSEDFLDTLNEYGTQFRKVGLSGEAATGLISQGLKAGARDADIVADSIKEFALRTQGNLEQTSSKGVVSLTPLGSAFEAVGIKGDKMYKMQENLAAGGAKSRKGLDTMLDGLRSIEDPVERSRAAVQLFGTQAEDMGDALYALDPSKAVDALGKVKGAADKAGAAFNDNAKAKIGTFFRGFQEDAVNILGGKVIPALEKLAPVIMPVVDFLGRNKSTVSAFIGVLAGFMIIQKVTAAVAAFNIMLAANPIGLVVVALAALAAGLVYAYKHSEAFRDIVNGAFRAVSAAAKFLWDGAIKPYFSLIRSEIELVGKAGTWLWNNALQPAFSGIVRGVGGMLNIWADMLHALAKVPGFGWADNAAGALRSAASRSDDFANSIRRIPNSSSTSFGTNGLGTAASNVQHYGSILAGLPRYIQTQIVTQHTDKFDRIAARAAGGPVRAGVPYLVGENGPELIVPDASGMVVNADGTQRLGNGGGTSAGGGDPGYVVVVVQSEDGRELQRKLLRVKRQSGVSLGLA